jgi:hypothetical protein
MLGTIAAVVVVSAVACSSSDGSKPPSGGTSTGSATAFTAAGTGGAGVNSQVPAAGNANGQGGVAGPNGPGGPPPGSGGMPGVIPPLGTGGGAPPPQGGAPSTGMGGAMAAGGNQTGMAGMSIGVPLTPKGKNCLKPGTGDYMNPGPYKVATKDVDLGMIAMGQHSGKFTIYYPDPLEAACLHPIVGWGNGTGVTDSNFTYNFLNSAAASWGMVVAASGEDNTGSGLFHKAGIDYLLKQNEDMTSPFFHKLSTRAGVGGHSQGGLGAGAAASHPNVVAAVVEGMTFVGTMKVPGLTMTGTNDIVMNAETTVTAATGPDFVAVWQGGNHVGTETVLGYLGLDTTSNDATGSQKGSIQFQRLYSAWFRCFLADDDVACKLFSGGTPSGCGICKDPGWAKLASKNM